MAGLNSVPRRRRPAAIATASLLVVLLFAASCSGDKYKTNETLVGRYVNQFCAANPGVCNGEKILVINFRAPVLVVHGPELYVREIKCSLGPGDTLDVTAHVTNVGDEPAVLSGDVPVYGTAYSGAMGSLFKLDMESDTLRSGTTIPLYVAGGPDSAVDMYFPLSKLGAGVNQIMVQIDPTYPQWIGGSYEYMYWPGGKESAPVSASALDLTNPGCLVSATPP